MSRPAPTSRWKSRSPRICSSSRREKRQKHDEREALSIAANGRVMWKDLGNGWVGYGISMKDIFCNPIASQKGIHVFYPSFIVVRFCLRVRRRGVRAAHTPHWPLLNTSRGGIWTNYIPITASIALRVQVLHTITVKIAPFPNEGSA